MRLVDGDELYWDPRDTPGTFRSVRLGGAVVMDIRDALMGRVAVFAALDRYKRAIFWLNLDELGADVYLE